MMTLGRPRARRPEPAAPRHQKLWLSRSGDEAQKKLQADHPHDPDGRVPEGDPEDFILDGLEIPEADEGGGIGFVEQVILQLAPDRLGRRHDDHRSRDRQRGVPETRPVSTGRVDDRLPWSRMPSGLGRWRATARLRPHLRIPMMVSR